MPTTASAFLKSPTDNVGPVVAAFGAERFLQHAVVKELITQILGEDADDEMGLTRFDGKDAEFQTVSDELRTLSMFGDRRIVIVDGADDFVTKHRSNLERYVGSPAKKSVLVLVVKKWPKTTKLYKAVEKQGTNIGCEAPKESDLPRWLGSLCELRYEKKLPASSAMVLLELAGTNLSQLDMELAKLSNYVGDRAEISREDVTALVGGWRAETTWELIDDVLAGNADGALTSLDKLLAAREAPLRILGGLTFKFRQFAIATEMSRQGSSLGSALQSAGIWRNQIADAERYLRRIGRPRAEKIQTWLLQTRDRLAGGAGNINPTQARIELEQLLIRLAGLEPTHR
ncbi:DNA polymerase III subunit delta [Thalassoroseus pseudoceratinae]|uniref:DNA polymerase III subunit delta n=1 Tax=Thalassoroseus pseudoceratinae TaxID=2713176 RepID=UPI00141F1CD1|nr:DNA polymerase III subunit delta [Thalassoroseus pseudoceratinae]